jgi:predicted XRE-type DNA-binding protein
MTPQQLKNLLDKNDIKQARIAADLGISRTAVCLVCNGYARSKRVEQVVARAVKLPRQRIFPIVPEPIKSREAA